MAPTVQLTREVADMDAEELQVKIEKTSSIISNIDDKLGKLKKNAANIEAITQHKAARKKHEAKLTMYEAALQHLDAVEAAYAEEATAKKSKKRRHVASSSDEEEQSNKKQKKKPSVRVQPVNEESDESDGSDKSAESDEPESGSEVQGTGKSGKAQSKRNRRRAERHKSKKTTEHKYRNREEILRGMAFVKGIRILEQSREMERNQAFLAGYLNLEDTHELGKVVHELKKFCKGFDAWKKRGFDVPDVKEKSTFAFKDIIKEIAKGDEAHESWKHLATVDKGDHFAADNPCFDKFNSTAKKNKGIFPKAVYVAATFKVLKKCKGLFKDTWSKEGPAQQLDSDVRWGTFAPPEDFHRAFVLFRFSINFWAKTKQPTFGKRDAAEVRYLTDEEYNNFRGVSGTGNAREDAIEEFKSVSKFLDEGDHGPDDVTERLLISRYQASDEAMDDLSKNDDVITARVNAMVTGKAKVRERNGPPTTEYPRRTMEWIHPWPLKVAKPGRVDVRNEKGTLEWMHRDTFQWMHSKVPFFPSSCDPSSQAGCNPWSL